MDPWTLAYLAGHRDLSITKGYVHTQEFSIVSSDLQIANLGRI
jgi:hypothetical protein